MEEEEEKIKAVAGPERGFDRVVVGDTLHHTCSSACLEGTLPSCSSPVAFIASLQAELLAPSTAGHSRSTSLS